MSDQKKKPYTTPKTIDIEKAPHVLLQEIRDKLSDIRNDLQILEEAYPFMKQYFDFAAPTLTSSIISLSYSQKECEKYVKCHGHNKFWHDYSNKVDINGKKIEIGQLVKVKKETVWDRYGEKVIPLDGIYQVHYICNSKTKILTLVQPQTEEDKLNGYISGQPCPPIDIFRIEDGPKYNLEIIG